jgi:hypothetical protein
MSFTSSTPTSAGFYWLTNQTYTTPVIVQVIQQPGGKPTAYLSSYLYVYYQGVIFSLDGTEQWEGPLSP